jgi:hypothetical protein
MGIRHALAANWRTISEREFVQTVLDQEEPVTARGGRIVHDPRAELAPLLAMLKSRMPVRASILVPPMAQEPVDQPTTTFSRIISAPAHSSEIVRTGLEAEGYADITFIGHEPERVAFVIGLEIDVPARAVFGSGPPRPNPASAPDPELGGVPSGSNGHAAGPQPGPDFEGEGEGEREHTATALEAVEDDAWARIAFVDLAGGATADDGNTDERLRIDLTDGDAADSEPIDHGDLHTEDAAIVVSEVLGEASDVWLPHAADAVPVPFNDEATASDETWERTVVDLEHDDLVEDEAGRGPGAGNAPQTNFTSDTDPEADIEIETTAELPDLSADNVVEEIAETSDEQADPSASKPNALDHDQLEQSPLAEDDVADTVDAIDSVVTDDAELDLPVEPNDEALPPDATDPIGKSDPDAAVPVLDDVPGNGPTSESRAAASAATDDAREMPSNPDAPSERDDTP